MCTVNTAVHLVSNVLWLWHMILFSLFDIKRVFPCAVSNTYRGCNMDLGRRRNCDKATCLRWLMMRISTLDSRQHRERPSTALHGPSCAAENRRAQRRRPPADTARRPDMVMLDPRGSMCHQRQVWHSGVALHRCTSTAEHEHIRVRVHSRRSKNCYDDLSSSS